jgi:hypothetical protein
MPRPEAWNHPLLRIDRFLTAARVLVIGVASRRHESPCDKQHDYAQLAYNGGYHPMCKTCLRDSSDSGDCFLPLIAFCVTRPVCCPLLPLRAACVILSSTECGSPYRSSEPLLRTTPTSISATLPTFV